MDVLGNEYMYNSGYRLVFSSGKYLYRKGQRYLY